MYRLVHFLVRNTGLLKLQGLEVSQTRVGAALRRAHPQHHQRRCISAGFLLNSVPYSSDFGHKVHVDQNEKLVMYEVTHVCAKDELCGKVFGFVTMPKQPRHFTHKFS